MAKIREYLGENGALKQLVPGFKVRQSQLDMADAVQHAIDTASIAVVEAGTGTGKTFAYLLPALLSDKKTIISTGTKNLQDQLFFKDFPLLQKAIKRPLKVVLLKGRANYLCLHRLETHAAESLYSNKKLIRDLAKVEKWAQLTRQGDIAELESVSEDSGIWPTVTSTNDNCLNGDCPLFKKCHVMHARKQALTADVVVINHHLFFADIALKQDGFGELLPHAKLVIFDEAHQLSDTATHFFSERASSRQILDLCQDTMSEYMQVGRDLEQIPLTIEKIKRQLALIRQGLGDLATRDVWKKVCNKPAVSNPLTACIQHLTYLGGLLQEIGERSKGLAACHERMQAILLLFKKLTTAADSENTVHWFETYSQSFSIYLTPINISEKFSNLLTEQSRAWVFTSATLTANNKFDHFSEQLGIGKANYLHLDSPFDYHKQAILHVPRGLPDPRADSYIQAMIDAVLPIITLTKGRTFLLFTSYAAMNKARDRLKTTPFELLVQGSMTKRELMKKFLATDNAILLGTSSFWEGVDVPGSALSCVIIDKLPFASPGDPILKAKMDSFRRRNIDPFKSYQLPEAIINLKQGIGRLIRHEKDTGILVICDPRMVAKYYGEQFLRSLPAMTLTRELSKVTEFYKENCS